MQFWYILLHLCHWSKRSLCEIAQLLTPYQITQPWHSAIEELVSSPGACRMQCRAGCSSKGVGDVHCAKGKEGLQFRAEQFPCLEMSVEKMPVFPECTVCVPVGWAKKMNLQKCNMTVSSTRYSVRIKFLYILGAEPWLSSAGGECKHHGVAFCSEAVSKQHKFCCTSEKPSLWSAVASFSAT